MRLHIKFLCACSGIRSDVLDAVPSGRVLAATQGAALLLVASFAALSGSYATYRVFNGDPYAAPISGLVGLLWGCLIFVVDRSVAMSIVRRPSRSLVIGVAMRLPLAALVAATMSTPLMLRISEPVLNADIRTRQRETVVRESRDNARAVGIDAFQADIRTLERQLGDAEERLRQEPVSEPYRAATVALARASQAYETSATGNGRLIAAARAELVRLAVAGEPTAADAERARALRVSISGWERVINQRAAAVSAARREHERIRADWVRHEQATRDRLVDAWREARVAQTRARTDLNERNTESANAWATLMRPSLITQYSAFRRIVANPEHPDAAALWRWEWALHTLFFLVETIVLMLKVLWPAGGPLERAVTAFDGQDKERVTLQHNRKFAEMRAMDAARGLLQQQAIRAWRREHSRRIRSSLRDISGRLARIGRDWQAVARTNEAA